MITCIKYKNQNKADTFELMVIMEYEDTVSIKFYGTFGYNKTRNECTCIKTKK